MVLLPSHSLVNPTDLAPAGLGNIHRLAHSSLHAVDLARPFGAAPALRTVPLPNPVEARTPWHQALEMQMLANRSPAHGPYSAVTRPSPSLVAVRSVVPCLTSGVDLAPRG